MNNVNLIGRLTKDVQIRYTASQTAVANINLAINGPNRTDYPEVVVYGKQAENLEKYCGKGSLVGVTGRIETGSYEKDGQKIYTTKVYSERVEFLSWKQGQNPEEEY